MLFSGCSFFSFCICSTLVFAFNSSSASTNLTTSSVVVNPAITLYNPSCNNVITSSLYTKVLSSAFDILALIASLILGDISSTSCSAILPLYPA